MIEDVKAEYAWGGGGGRGEGLQDGETGRNDLAARD